jgi:hypothetical protein
VLQASLGAHRGHRARAWRQAAAQAVTSPRRQRVAAWAGGAVDAGARRLAQAKTSGVVGGLCVAARGGRRQRARTPSSPSLAITLGGGRESRRCLDGRSGSGGGRSSNGGGCSRGGRTAQRARRGRPQRRRGCRAHAIGRGGVAGGRPRRARSEGLEAAPDRIGPAVGPARAAREGAAGARACGRGGSGGCGWCGGGESG